MSGGATVRTLPISAVRSLSLPVPTAEDCAQAEEELKLAAEMREDIETRKQNLAQAKNALWHKLWHLPPEIGVEYAVHYSELGKVAPEAVHGGEQPEEPAGESKARPKADPPKSQPPRGEIDTDAGESW